MSYFLTTKKSSFLIISTLLLLLPKLSGITVPYKNFVLDPMPMMVREEMISPNGKYVASLHSTPSARVLEIDPIVVKKGATSLDTAHSITHQETRIAGLTWTRDSRYVLFFEDQGGNENFHIYRFDPSHPEKKAVDLTPQPQAQARILSLPKNHPDQAVIETNARDQRFFDVYRLNLKNGKCDLLEKNPGNVLDWVADAQGAIRARYVIKGTNVKIETRPSEQEPFHLLTTCAFDDTPSIYGFSPDGKSLYFSRTKEKDTTSLIEINLSTSKERFITNDPHYDISEVLLSDRTGKILATGIFKEDFIYLPCDSKIKSDLHILHSIDQGDLHLQNCSDDESKWLVLFNSPKNSATYLYDRTTKKISLLHRSTKNFIASAKPITFKSRDGLLIHGYLFLPKNKPLKNLPLVAFIHGGPWARDQWGFNKDIQDLTEAGFAVLKVNYRGSTGYGKKFLQAGDKEFGGKMISDIIDGTEAIVARGIADPHRLGIYGASYGGYATVAAVTFYPDVFACGVDYVGVSDLITLFKTFIPYWDPLMPVLDQRIGNPKTESSLLLKQSPITQVDKIKVPLFIAYGANDVRVNRIQSDKLIKALQDQGKLAEPPLFKEDEGHGFRNFNNAADFNQRCLAFLKKYLLRQRGGMQESVSKANKNK
ncbi:MAG: S9 family peptidase [Verrucomicrobiae bacterium]|nr:S9 family peptidase [Verrucomicrobiae bacterium]